MLIALNDITANDGKVIQVNAELEQKFMTFGFEKYPITDSEPVAFTIQNKGDKKLLISGKTEVALELPCDRCLDSVSVKIPVDFEKEVDMNLSEEERRQALDEQHYIDGYNLDVDKLVCSEILVNWPTKVLCKESCKGICPTCGMNLNLGNCDCSPTDLDPRMAKIQEIFQEFKEV